jgi:hypothetical protein
MTVLAGSQDTTSRPFPSCDLCIMQAKWSTFPCRLTSINLIYAENKDVEIDLPVQHMVVTASDMAL